jgi:ribosome recycling factor
LDSVRVDYYGTPTPLNQVAAIAIPDPRMIIVTPWDKSQVAAVEKAIQIADLGLNPQRDGNLIRLPIPPLTEERRKEMAKRCSKIAEESKVAIRNIRRDLNESLKKAEKNKEITEDENRRDQDIVQKSTDKFIKQIDEILAEKEKEIMSV